MRKLCAKLSLVTLLLLGVVCPLASTKAMASYCDDYCVDPQCFCVIHCYAAGGDCMCDQFCSIGIGNGGQS